MIRVSFFLWRETGCLPRPTKQKFQYTVGYSNSWLHKNNKVFIYISRSGTRGCTIWQLGCCVDWGRKRTAWPCGTKWQLCVADWWDGITAWWLSGWTESQISSRRLWRNCGLLYASRDQTQELGWLLTEISSCPACPRVMGFSTKRFG